MSTQMTLDTPVTRSENNLSSTLAGEEVVLDLHDGVYYGLDEVGARVWGLIDNPSTPRDICDVLHQEYDVERSTLEKDVLDLLTEMEKEGLVVRPASAEAEVD